MLKEKHKHNSLFYNFINGLWKMALKVLEKLSSSNLESGLEHLYQVQFTSKLAHHKLE